MIPNAARTDATEKVIVGLDRLLRPHGAERLIPDILKITAPPPPALYNAPAAKLAGLTGREAQVLDGVSRGLVNGDIGEELNLSEDTIKTHLRTLFKKLRCRNRAQAVAIAYECGLLGPRPS